MTAHLPKDTQQAITTEVTQSILEAPYVEEALLLIGKPAPSRKIRSGVPEPEKAPGL